MHSGDNHGDTISLNILPMLDIFSILILFLLMNFSSDPVSHEISTNTTLPVSATLKSLDEIPTITMTKKEIFVNGKKITNIVNQDVPRNEILQGAVLGVYKELEKIAEVNKKFNESGKKKADTVTLEVDKSHKFNLIKRVLISSQQADFIKFKFMVSKTTE